MVVLMLCALLCALFFAVPKVLSFAASVVMTPVHTINTYFAESSGALPQYIRSRSALVDEIESLKEALLARRGDQYTVELLQQENEALRALLGDGAQKHIVAGVIGRPNKLPYDVLVLDKGAQDGIIEGAPVFIGEHTVIGRVGKVFPDSALVELVTSPGFTVSVYILGPDIYTNAQGIGGGQLRVEVPQGIELSVGDLVILPSVNSGIYGAISVVDSDPSQPQQYGYVSPEIPLASLRLVGVGTQPLERVSFEEAQAAVAETKSAVFTVPVPEGLLITAEQGSSTATSTGTSSTAAQSTTSTDTP